MILGIVGGGVVGKAMARAFMEHCEIRVYDCVLAKATHRLAETLAADLIFVCLPTPQEPGKLSCDTVYLDDFFGTLKDYAIPVPGGVQYQLHRPANEANFVIRSTVPIGYTRKAAERFNLTSICHSPEFLTARCAATDAQTPARNIIGNPSSVEVSPAARRLFDLYTARFPGVPCHGMTSNESELVKLAVNSFFAVKVAFFNEVRILSDRLGLDWDDVISGILSDGRIAHSHTLVPGPDGERGFGGACLPKDLASFADCLSPLLGGKSVAFAAYEQNRLIRERGDWSPMLNRPK